MAKLEGVVVYTIEKNGCLNGVYANDSTPTPHEVFNEVAKLVGDYTANDKISGKYLASWISDGSIVNGELVIVRGNNFYQVDWYLTGGRHVFKGKGFITGPHQFTVPYTNV